MVTLLSFKIIAAIAIFSAAFFAGILPAMFDEKPGRGRFLAEALASGIFIGAALFHMLPDAQNGFTTLDISYPVAILLCVSGFILLTIIERSSKTLNKKMHSAKITGILLTVILSIHSIIEGAALGINMTIAGAFVIFIAILVHKSLASFALVVSLRRADFRMRRVMTMLVVFSIMTPLGIFMASMIGSLLAHDSGILAESTLNAITAGSFLYIGTLDTLGKQLKPQRLIERLREFSAFMVGLVLMGIVAAWV